MDYKMFHCLIRQYKNGLISRALFVLEWALEQKRQAYARYLKKQPPNEG